MSFSARIDIALRKALAAIRILCCAVCFLMMAHIVADIVAKFVFNDPMFGTIEIVSGYYMVMLVFLPLVLVSENEGHIFVELFTRGLPTRTVARMDDMAKLVTILVMAFLLWVTADEALLRSAEGEVWEISGSSMVIWPSRWFVPIGSALMIAYMLVQMALERSHGRNER